MQTSIGSARASPEVATNPPGAVAHGDEAVADAETSTSSARASPEAPTNPPGPVGNGDEAVPDAETCIGSATASPGAPTNPPGTVADDGVACAGGETSIGDAGSGADGSAATAIWAARASAAACAAFQRARRFFHSTSNCCVVNGAPGKAAADKGTCADQRSILKKLCHLHHVDLCRLSVD